jgi:glycosyltransferase involved in cell wall biosynthesis
VEDFGIAPLEARLAGCPIITQRLSGSSELIGEGKGVYYLDGENDENDENIIAYLKEIWKAPVNRLDIRRQARQYAGARWRHDWSSVVNATQRSVQKKDQDKGNRKGL